MFFKDKIVIFFSIVFCLGFLAAAGYQMDYINQKRVEMNLVANKPLKNAPPSLAFSTVALGAFRGLIVDVLWMRADRLKQQGQFFDAKQLAEWITTLQPRFAKVWEFQAWNMAYNISVSFPETQPEEKWRWVKNGYELLRDEGIPLNPKSILLYRELARIFQHKIGMFSDDNHKYYKLKLAEAMEPLLGPADNEYFEKLIKAPEKFDELIKDSEISKIVESLKRADESFKNKEKFAENFLSLKQTPKRYDPNCQVVLDTYKGSDALEKIQLYSAAHQLRNEWKLEPELMHEINKVYGPTPWNDPDSRLPLDWRVAESHAIYWAVKGLKETGREDYNVAQTNTDRIVGHSIQNLFRHGKLFIYDYPVFDEEGNQIETKKTVFMRPDLRMFNTYNQVMLDVMKIYENIKRTGTRQSFKIGHRNMLINALFSFYQAGHEQRAKDIYEMLRERYPDKKFEVPLPVFVQRRLKEEISVLSFSDVKEQVLMLLRESYFRFALGDNDQAYAKEKMAKEIYDFYYSDTRDENRINLPEFKILRFTALLDFFNDQQYPAELRLDLIQRLQEERPEIADQMREIQQRLQSQVEQKEESEQ